MSARRTRAARGEGQIGRRPAPDGRWYWRYTAGFDESGKQVRKIVYGRTETEVLERKREILRQRDAGKVTLVKGRSRTLEDYWLERWLSARRDVNGRRAKTLQRYEQIMRLHVLPTLGRKPVREIRPNDVHELIAAKSRERLAPRTVGHIYAVMRNCFGFIARLGEIPSNPVAAIDYQPPQPYQGDDEDAEVGRVLDEEQADRFATAARSLDTPDGPLFLLALVTGARQSELLALRWSDFEPSASPRPKLHIRRSIHRVDGEWRFENPKTKGSRRDLDLPAAAVEALERERSLQAALQLKAGERWQGDRWGGLVFTGALGSPIDPWALRRRFARLLAGNGLPAIRFHDLRGTAVTLMLERGIPPKQVMAYVGHASLTTTMSIYAKVTGKGRAAAADAMDAILGGAGR